jgi:hypothetical protein
MGLGPPYALYRIVFNCLYAVTISVTVLGLYSKLSKNVDSESIWVDCVPRIDLALRLNICILNSP